ncbi:DUF4870 domain-containing protein [Micromonospora siamensis]|uniref:DUF4870 domain-containing protein n=1 Tax=Micromonospora siamensis TaxID=299152 RepID=A0A1C5JTP6_9ACTN|nr:DUF4870 domain-containing protein [Micromonospora siamensis]SCG73970.1 hypothetical protein GA0074704_4978 [Micromonospora siamensis]
MTEPPRPPGSGEPGPYQPEPTPPSAPFGPPAGGEPTAPLSGAPGQPTAGDSPPPAGGYPPPGGHPPPGVGYPTGGAYGPPVGYANGEDKTWALVAHWGGAAATFFTAWLGFLPPLIAMMGRGAQSPTVRAHAVEALNFQLTWLGASVALSIVLCCGTVVTLGLGSVLFVLLGGPWLVGVIFGVIAGVKAGEGQLYRYPMSIRLVK